MYEIKRSYYEPYPTKRPKRGTPKYPFHDCGIGDSFFVPAKDAATSSVRAAAASYGSRHKKFRFTCEAMEDYEGQGPGTLVTRRWVRM